MLSQYPQKGSYSFCCLFPSTYFVIKLGKGSGWSLTLGLLSWMLFFLSQFDSRLLLWVTALPPPLFPGFHWVVISDQIKSYISSGLWKDHLFIHLITIFLSHIIGWRQTKVWTSYLHEALNIIIYHFLITAVLFLSILYPFFSIGLTHKRN